MQRRSTTADSTENLLSRRHDKAHVSLVGVLHLDIDAKDALFDLLNNLKPDCIAVEISKFSICYRSVHEKEWLAKFEEILLELPAGKRSHFRLELLKRQLRMPFEWEVAKSYGEATGTQVVPVDCGQISQKELPSWSNELLCKDNLLLVTSEPDQAIEHYFAEHYKRAAYYLTRPEGLSGPIEMFFDTEWQKREKFLAERTLDLASKNKKVVYIGGWMHLLRATTVLNLVAMLGQVLRERFLVTGNTVHKL